MVAWLASEECSFTHRLGVRHLGRPRDLLIRCALARRAHDLRAGASGGCQSYLVGCEDTCAAALIDPGDQPDRPLPGAGGATRPAHPLRHRHPHPRRPFLGHAGSSAQRSDVPVVMHRASPAPFVDLRLDDGDMLHRRRAAPAGAAHAGPHRAIRCAWCVDDRVFTGDTLLIGGTGRTDLPTGDPDALYDSLFDRLLKLDPALQVYPAHDYKGRSHSTIGARDRRQSAPAEARARRVRRR